MPLNDINEVQLSIPDKIKRDDVDVIELNDELIACLQVKNPEVLYNKKYDTYYNPYSLYIPNTFPITPKIGQIWIYDNTNEQFPQGFIGKCTGVSNVKYSNDLTAYFEPADYSDAYESYYSCFQYSPDNELLHPDLQPQESKNLPQNNTTISSSKTIVADNDFFLPWHKLSLNAELSKNIWKDSLFSLGAEINCELAVRYGVKYTVSRLVENNATTTTIDIYGSSQATINISAAFNGSVKKEIPITPDIQQRIPMLPCVVGGLYAAFDIELSGKVGLEMINYSTTLNYGLRAVIKSDVDNEIEFSPSFRQESNIEDTKGFGEGEISIGLSLRPYVALLNRHLVSLSPSIYYNFIGNIQAPIAADAWERSDRSSMLYSYLSDDEAVTVNFVAGIGGRYKLLGINQELKSDLVTIPLFNKPLIPAISEFDYRLSSANEIDVLAQLKNYEWNKSPLLNIPKDWGFLAYEINEQGELSNNPVSQIWVQTDSKTGDYFSGQLTNLDQRKNYRIFVASRPFSQFGSSHIVCGPSIETTVFDPPKSQGVFKASYFALPKNITDGYNSKDLLNRWHYVYNLTFPAFDFSNYVDKDTEEWGWFIMDITDYYTYTDSINIAEIAEDKLNGDYYTEIYGIVKHPMNSLKTSATSKDCIFWQPHEERVNRVHIFSHDGILGYYKKQKDKIYEEYKVLIAEKCKVASHEIPDLRFSNLSVSPVRNKYGCTGNIDIAFDVNLTGGSSLTNALYFLRLYPSNDLYTFFSGNSIGTLESDDGVFEGTCTPGYTNYRDIDYKDIFYQKEPNLSSDAWDAYIVKPKYHFVAHNLPQFGEWPNVITLGLGYEDTTTILSNHLYIDLQLYSRKINNNYYNYLKSKKCQIRPGGWPFLINNEKDTRSYYNYRF